MRFLIDDQLPAMLAGVFAEFGVDARHVVDLGLGGAADERIWRFACANEWIVTTKDADFIRLHRSTDPRAGRVLWLRCGNQRTPHLAAAVRTQLPRCLALLRQGRQVVELR